MRILLITVILTGLLYAALAIPLIQQRVPPNPLYGFRVPATLRDRELWYRVNRRAGWMLLLAGIVNALGALLLYRPFHDRLDIYGLAMAAVIVTTTLAIVTLGLR